MLITQLLHELGRVPVWALVMLVNLSAAVGCLLWLDPEIRTPNRAWRVAVTGAMVVVAAVVGLYIVGCVALASWIEGRAWQEIGSEEPKATRPPRRAA